MKKIKYTTLSMLLVVLTCFLFIGCGGGHNYVAEKRVPYEPPQVPECKKWGFGYVKYINSSKYDILILSNDIHRVEELSRQKYMTVDEVPMGVYSCQYRYLGKNRSKVMSKTFRISACDEVEVLLD